MVADIPPKDGEITALNGRVETNVKGFLRRGQLHWVDSSLGDMNLSAGHPELVKVRRSCPPILMIDLHLVSGYRRSLGSASGSI